MAKDFGYKVMGTITSKRGLCRFGHEVGQTFELSGRQTGGICGYLYHTIFPFILVIQCGGVWHEGEEELPEFECPDVAAGVRIKLRREK